MSKLRVALVFGGRSSEHEISCVTAGGVLGAIDREKFDVVPIGITKDGIFVPAEDSTEKWALNKEQLPTVEFEGKTLTFLPNREIAINGESAGKIDVVFPVLHGPFGEDGTIQGFFELLDLPYVGNGVLASAAGMDKEFTKALFEAAGVPVTPHVVIRKSKWMRDPETALEAVKGLGSLPLFVKPARAGSSVGVSKVSDMSSFADAVAKAFEEDDKLVVERAVIGREVEVAVLEGRNGEPTRVSVAGEIIVKGRDFYDFEAKYLDEDSVDLVIPADLTENELQEMQAIARKAFAAIGGEGLSRVDFFLTKNGFIVNEINTMPGFTRLSMFPSLWKASGIDYKTLITELIELALK
jgi:D-alanine-D-alanine ligase